VKPYSTESYLHSRNLSLFVEVEDPANAVFFPSSKESVSDEWTFYGNPNEHAD
jgi:hypothetical protein